MKKAISVILLLSLVPCLVCCGGKEDNASETTAAETAGAATDTAEESFVFADISGIPSPFSINGIDVPYPFFRYYFGAVKYKYDNGNLSYWENNDYTEKIREEVMKYIRRSYALEECAKQYGVELTDAEKRKVEQTLMSERLQFSDDDEYYRFLESNYCDEETYLRVEELASLEEKLFSYLTGSESGPKISDNTALIQRYIDNYVIRCDHILILNDDGDDVNENETLAKELYEKLKAGEDFETLKEKYSEDEQTNKTDTGYYIAEGDISQILSDTAFSLEVGQISEVVYAPYGYHIVKRLEKDGDYIKDNMKEVFLQFYQSHMLGEMLKKIIEKQNVVYDGSYYFYTPTTLK